MSFQPRLWPLRKPLLWLSSALALLLVSCAGDSAPTPDWLLAARPGDPAAGTPIPLPSDSYNDSRRNGIIRGAAWFATASGCPSAGLALSGPPTRILAAFTEAGNASGLINPEASLYTPPEGVPPLMVWVIALEGQGADMATGAEAGSRAFVFVIDPINVRYTGCVVRDAPLPAHYQEPSSGGFEFEVLLGTERLAAAP